jgi:hypothetical protein
MGEAESFFFQAIMIRSILPLPRRARAATIHLAFSAAVAAVAAVVVFGFWYPPPFAAIAGGASIFLILVSVDVILGPTLTAIVAGPAKPLKELRVDLAIIVAVQLAAFAYGVYAVALGRPVWLAFEVNSFRVVTAADIEAKSLVEGLPEFRELSWRGPKVIAAVRPSDADGQLRSIDLGLAGIDLSMEPRNWRPFPTVAETAWGRARPLAQLVAKYPQRAAEVEAIAKAAGQPVEALRFLPVQAHRAEWIVVVAPPGAQIVGYLHVDGFF